MPDCPAHTCFLVNDLDQTTDDWRNTLADIDPAQLHEQLGHLPDADVVSSLKRGNVLSNNAAPAACPAMVDVRRPEEWSPGRRRKVKPGFETARSG